MRRRIRTLPKHCTWAIDRHGKARVRFQKNRFSTYLRGEPGSAEFLKGYEAALALAVRDRDAVSSTVEHARGFTYHRPVGVKVAPVNALSALPGGVKHPGAQPLIGVYLLLLKGQIVYIGESLNMPQRVATHRANGRPFDQAFYV